MTASRKISLRSVLETVEGLVSALAKHKRALGEGTPPDPAEAARIEDLNARLTREMEQLRAIEPGESDLSRAEASALKAELEKRFMVAFRLTRENEELLKRPPAASATPQAAAPRPPRREIERQYRERMRRGNQSPGPKGD